MKLQNLALTLTSIITISACSIANAQSEQDFNIYVYKDCQQIKKIQMSEYQINAYTELKKHEKLMASLELPMKDMERKLSIHEQELDALSGELVVESGDELTVNKALMKKHTAIAHKMEQVVAEHRMDIHDLELQAQEIRQAAHEFEQAIQPSLGEYKEKDIQVQIGSNNRSWDCRA